MIRRISIIGLGLIGGSMGRALSEKGYEITGIDKDRTTLEQGLKLGAASRVTQDLKAGLADAQVVVLAVPVGAAAGLIRSISPYLQPGVIVSDVGSVKTNLVELAATMLPAGVEFVGGHPMAGTEQAGIAGANPLLFNDAFYVITPGVNCSPRSVEIITELVRILGAVPVIMDCVKHDRAVATLSHLPHLVAVALAQAARCLEKEQPGSLNLAAGSFRDGTRVAESSPVMWQEVCLANKEMILGSLQTFREQLNKLERAVRNETGEVIHQAFDEAGGIRGAYRRQVKGKLADLVEMLVAVPNSPGALGMVTKALGEGNINIANIEVLQVEDGAPGRIILGVQGEAASLRALELLQGLGLKVDRN